MAKRHLLLTPWLLTIGAYAWMLSTFNPVAILSAAIFGGISGISTGVWLIAGDEKISRGGKP